uniref:glutathione transferase n=1 Tax=Saccoglossus kowalevskii TaxID=10224 RepID=A0ABM0MYE3_SACKO|nr:PREDICTED: glutathione S-transferase-like [Saccoglossus kowalevskii]
MYDNWPGEWTALKSSPGISRFLFARVPILEVDGVTIAESQAIARFLARRHGKELMFIVMMYILFYHRVDGILGVYMLMTFLDQAKIDMITDTMKDISEKLRDIWFAKENKQKLMDKYFNDVFPLLLQGLERVLKENNAGDGYYVGDKVTLADLSFADICYCMMKLRPDVLKDFPKLDSLKKRVESRPRIAEWMKKRPESNI